jgi:hypothetical protein
MKVSQLRELLDNYPDSAQVLVTWEGIFRRVNSKHVYRAPNGTVVIDADDNHYKNRILSGELVPKDGR